MGKRKFLKYETKKKSELIEELKQLEKKVRLLESALKMKEALRENEGHYHLLFQRLLVGIFHYDTQLRIIDYNDSFVSILQSTPTRLAGLDMKMLNDKSVLPAISEAIEGRDGFYEGFYKATTSPAEIYISLHTTPLLNRRGEIIGGVGIVEDNTLCKRCEDKMAEKEKRYRLLFDLSPSGIILEDTNGKILDVNEAFCKFTGYTKEELIGQNIRILVPTQNLPDVDKHISEIIAGKTFEHEVVDVRKDGTLCSLELHETLVSLPDGEKRILSIANDITERKQAEDALRESEERFRLLAESSLTGIYLIEDRLFRYVNQALATIFGYTVEEIVDRLGPFDLTYADDRQRVIENIRRRVTGEIESVRYDFRGMRKDGAIIHVEVYGRRIEYGGKIGIIGTLIDITKRKHAEEALRASEQSYRHIVDFAPIGIYRSSLEGKILSANKTFARILGYDSPEELLEKNMGEDIYYIKEDREKLIQEFEGAGVAIDLERQWKKKDGTPIWIQGNSRAVKDETGKIKYFEGFVRDITERKRAEEALKESERFLNNIVENIPNMLFVKDANELRFVRFNKAGEALIGYSKEEMYGKNDYDFFPKDEANFFTEKDREALLNKKSIDIPEETVRTRYQGERILHTKKIPILDSNGNPLYLLGISEDITERKQAEMLQNAVYQISQAADQAVSSEELFKSVHEIIGSVMPVKNLYVALYDEKNDLISYPYYVDEFDSPSPPTKLRKGLTEYVLRTGKPLLCDETANKKLQELGEIELVGTQSPIWLGVPLIVENKSIGVIVVQHYSDPKAYSEKDLQMLEYVSSQVAHTVERKLKEEELLNAKERAESSEKLKQEFLAQMSHEVRTPLNILLNYSNDIYDTLEEKNQLTEEIEKSFLRVKNAGARIIRTMELILNMSEVHTGSYQNNPRQTDIYSEILNRLYIEFKPLAEEKNLKFVLLRNTEVTSSKVDSFAIEQIFKNLIDNAIKFTHEGSVEIRINRNEAGNLTASIEDTGIGIAEEYLPNLYSLFSQERQGYTRPFDGSGLGLALSKRFCEMNNVLIEVSSTKGKGTKFILTFPN